MLYLDTVTLETLVAARQHSPVYCFVGVGLKRVSIIRIERLRVLRAIGESHRLDSRNGNTEVAEFATLYQFLGS